MRMDALRRLMLCAPVLLWVIVPPRLTAGFLLDHRKVTGREQIGVQYIPKRNRPALVEVVESVGADAGPVVNRHGTILLVA